MRSQTSRTKRREQFGSVGHLDFKHLLPAMEFSLRAITRNHFVKFFTNFNANDHRLLALPTDVGVWCAMGSAEFSFPNEPSFFATRVEKGHR